MSDNIVSRFIGDAKTALAQIAEDSMMLGQPGEFEHGRACGKYQGLKFALEILEDLLRDVNEKESRS